MRTLLGLVLAGLRRRPGRSSVLLIVITCGAAMAVVVVSLTHSAQASVRSAQTATLGGDLEVASATDSGFDEAMFFGITDLPGVAAAIPIVQAPVVVGGRGAYLIGVDQRAESLQAQLTRSLDRASTVLSTHLDSVIVGGELRGDVRNGRITIVDSGGVPTEVPVVGSADTGSISINGGSFVIAPLPLAQSISGRPARLDAIVVEATDGADIAALRHDLRDVAGPGVIIDSPQERNEAAVTSLLGLQQGQLMLSIVIAVIAGCLVWIGSGATFEQRRRELALLRAVGASRAWVVLVFLTEAAVLGLLGGLLGTLIGVPYARSLVHSVPKIGDGILALRLTFSMPSSAPVVAVTVGVLTTVTASLGAALRGSKVSPVESMRTSQVEFIETSRRLTTTEAALLTFGTCCLAGATVLIVAAPGGATLEMPLLVIGVVLAVSSGARVLVAHLGGAVEYTRLGAAVRASLERAPKRASATVLAVCFTIAAVISVGGIVANTRQSAYDLQLAYGGPGLSVFPRVSAGSDLNAFPTGFDTAVGQLDGIARVDDVYFGHSVLDDDAIDVVGAPRTSGEPPMGGASSAALNALDRGEALISQRLADVADLDVGDHLRLAGSDRVVDLTVGGIAPVFSNVPTVGITSETFVALFPDATPSKLEVTLAPGAAEADVRTAIGRLGTEHGLAPTIRNGREALDFVESSIDDVVRPFELLRLAILVFAGLALANTLALSVAERRREIAVVRATGATAGQVLLLTFLESAVLGVTGGGLGIVVGFLFHRAGVSAMGSSTGFPIAFSLDGEAALVALGGGLVVGVLATLAAAARAARNPILAGLANE